MINELKIEWVSRAKGIGIIFVVLGHVLRGLNNASLFKGTYFVFSDYFIYTFHMPLFFFISGMFFLKSFEKRGQYSFIKNKFSVLFYLYLLWSVIQFIVQYGLNKYTNGNTVFSDLFWIPIIPKGHMWFLYALLIIFIFNALLFSFISKNRYKSLLFLLFSVGLFFRIYDLTEIVILNRVLKNIFFFELGIVFSFLKQTKKNLHYNGYMILLLSFLSYVGCVIFNYYKENFSYDSQILPALFGIIFFCFLVYFIKSKILEYLGLYSLEIYLAHILFASGTRILMNKIFYIENLYLHIFAGLLMGILGPILLVQLSKRYLAFRFLFENPIKA